jgi:hypothetical protein
VHQVLGHSLPESGLQGSPIPSLSSSSWPRLNTRGQLSQASPTPSLSLSAWLGFDVVGAGEDMQLPGVGSQPELVLN